MGVADQDVTAARNLRTGVLLKVPRPSSSSSRPGSVNEPIVAAPPSSPRSEPQDRPPQPCDHAPTGVAPNDDALCREHAVSWRPDAGEWRNESGWQGVSAWFE